MSTIHTYNGIELKSYIIIELEAAISNAKYTFEVIKIDGDKVGSINHCCTIQIAENNITKQDLLSRINNSLPLNKLSSNISHVECPGNGTSTVDVIISNPQKELSLNKICRAKLIDSVGLIKITPSSKFNSDGLAIFTIGPTPSDNMISSLFEIEFYVDDEPYITPCRITCQYIG